MKEEYDFSKAEQGKFYIDPRLSYDEEADTLYINFKKQSFADDSELTNNDVIVRYQGEQVIGLTILNASKRSPFPHL